MYVELCNEDRAERGQAGLNAYQELPGNDGDTLTDIGDLIANLLHLAAQYGMEDAQAFVNTQVMHFEAEVEEEGD